jgi:mono/diheme cytochrome c family protein
MSRIATVILFILVLFLPFSLYWSQRSSTHGEQINLTARTAMSGGWSQDGIVLQAGEPVTFRLTSEDVVHGFAIGHVDLQPVDVLPGEWSTFHWNPQQPGEYTFYCTRWCGPDHWRMTGSIQVVDEANIYPRATPPAAPRYQVFGVNIDERETIPGLSEIRLQAMPLAQVSVPVAAWQDKRDPDLTTPLDAFEKLRQEPILVAFSDAEVWNLVAYLWLQDLEPPLVEAGRNIFESNCSACHGPTGAGDGVMASAFDDPVVANFTDLSRMATTNTILLEGKILRGGMGTGMPYWGTILTVEKIGAVVDYLWTLILD